MGGGLAGTQTLGRKCGGGAGQRKAPEFAIFASLNSKPGEAGERQGKLPRRGGEKMQNLRTVSQSKDQQTGCLLSISRFQCPRQQIVYKGVSMVNAGSGPELLLCTLCMFRG